VGVSTNDGFGRIDVKRERERRLAWQRESWGNETIQPCHHDVANMCPSNDLNDFGPTEQGEKIE